MNTKDIPWHKVHCDIPISVVQLHVQGHQPLLSPYSQFPSFPIRVPSENDVFSAVVAEQRFELVQ